MRKSPDHRPPQDRVTRLGVSLLIGVAPFVLLRTGGEFENTPKAVFLQCGITALALWWLVKRRSGPSPNWTRTPIDIPLLLFTATGLLSLTRAVNPFAALPSLLHWGAGLILFFYAAHSLSGPQAVPRIFLGAALSSGAVSVIGIAQVWFGLDWIPQAAPPAATFGNRNMASHFVAIWFPSALYLVAASESARTRTTGAACLVLSTVYLLYTRTLASWLAVLVVVLVVAIVWPFVTRRRLRTRFWMWASLAVASGLLVVCLAGLVTASDGLDSDEEIARRLAEFAGTDAGTGALRLIFWKNTLAMARDHPWLGVGPANFALHYPRYHRAADVDWTFDEEHQLERAHNDHLQILAERGLPGFVAWVSVFFVALLSAGKLLREPERWIRLQALFVGLGIVAFAIVACFSFPAERALPPIQLCALLGMLGALQVAGRRERFPELRFPSWARSVFVVILVVYLATSVGAARRAVLSDIHYTEGVRRMHAGQYEMAASALYKARAATPRDANVLLMLAGNLASMNRCHVALEILREVLRVHPYKVNAMSNSGYCHLKLGEYAEARRWFEAALEILPDSPELHTNLGTTHAEQGEHDRAIEAYLDAVELAETTPFLPSARIEARLLQPRLLLAKTYVARGQFLEAIAQYETILEHEPDLTDVRRVLAELHRELEKAE